jgi:pyruvate formate-lyase/glycerol dehydratase family glycyl radical enzyme
MASEQEFKRTIRLKNNLLSSKYELCIERMKFFTEAYQNYPGDPPVIKRAKAAAHTLRNMTIFIREDELLVGNETSKNLGEKINLDLQRFNNGFDKKSTYEELANRNPQPFFIDENDMNELMAMTSYWQGRSLVGDIIHQALLNKNLIAPQGQFASVLPNIAIQIGTTEGHLSAGYEKLLTLGYKGIIREAEHYQKGLSKDDREFKGKSDFYEAVKIYYTAAIAFSQRFSDLAFDLAGKEQKKERRNELISIGEMMHKFMAQPPDTFYEAVQFIWFSQNIANIIYQRSVLAPGRLDQILRPYYERDRQTGKITREFALELIEELNLKLTWNVVLIPTELTMIANALGQNTQTITIGGVKPDGTDATNDLSYLFLEAYKNLKAFTTDLSVRIHQNTPKEFFMEALSVFKSTSGIAFYNDDVIVPALAKAGYAAEDALDYVIIGCVEPTGQGNSFAATGRMFMNLPGVLELTLNKGVSGLSGLVDGLETGDPAGFLTFDDLYRAFVRQLTFNIERSVQIAEVGDREAMTYFQHPFVSAMIDGCMENGKDYVTGGAKYNLSSITGYGFATLVDSLHHIKKVVYDEKMLSLPDLIKILNSDFAGQESLRQKLLSQYDKWGNDQAEIDGFACQLWDLFTREVARHAPLRGGRYSAGAYSMGVHVMEGFFTRPTADGRRAFEPISNSLSPVNGAEKSGITAVLNSVAKLNYQYAANGVAVNVRIHPQNLEKEENLEKFYWLLKAYFLNGGMQIQPTVVSTETLRDAQKNPEKYKDLIVKVGGYNATYIDLGAPIQNEIISRLENR